MFYMRKDWLIGMAVILLLPLPSYGQTQVVFDGSVGAAISGEVPGNVGSVYTIDQAKGNTPGVSTNLFHSFTQFNVGNGDTVTFASDGSVNNIIARVTGREGAGWNLIAGDKSSTIDGAVTSPNASLWLINPYGIIVTDGASFDIGGGLYLSTADEVLFRNGSPGDGFSSSVQAPMLSIGDPAGFGFLTVTEAYTDGDISISLGGSAIEVDLGVSERFAVVGRDLQFENGTINVFAATEVYLAAGLSGDYYIDADGLSNLRHSDVWSFLADGDNGYAVTALSSVALSDFAPSGNVHIASGSFVTTDFSFGNGFFGNSSADKILVGGTINLTGVSSIYGSPSNLFEVYGTDIDLTEPALNFTSSAEGNDYIFSSVTDMDVENLVAEFRTEKGNPVLAFWANDNLVVNNSVVESLSADRRTQKTDYIFVGHDLVRFYESSFGLTSFVLDSENVGSIRVLSGWNDLGAGIVELINSTIAASTNSLDPVVVGDFAVGVLADFDDRVLAGDTLNTKAGNIIIEGNIVTLEGAVDTNDDMCGGGGCSDTQILTERYFSGHGGSNSSITADQTLNINANASISLEVGEGDADLLALGGGKYAPLLAGIAEEDAGKITITAGTLNISGGSISGASNGVGLGAQVIANVTTTDLDGATITSTTSGTGNASEINIISSGTFTITDSTISSESTSTGTDAGSAGLINISGEGVTIKNSTVSTTTASNNTSNTKGNITVDAGDGLLFLDGSTGTVTMSASTSGAANGGDITLSSEGAITTNNTDISSNTSSGGDAGAITMIVGGDLTIDTTDISASTEGTGDAGSVGITVAGNAIVTDADVSSTTDAAGNAKLVSLAVTGDVNLDGVELSSAADDGSTGNAGVVTIAGSLITIENGSEVTSSSSGTGNANQVAVSGTSLTLDSSTISAEAEIVNAGSAGTVTVTLSDDLTIRNDGLISSSTASANNAGNVEVTVGGQLSMSGDDSSIASITTGGGNAGTVSVTADTINLNAVEISSAADDGSTGNAGLVAITGNTMLFENGAEISSSSEGTGNARDVTINAGTLTVANSEITAAAEEMISGSAGAVTVNVTNDLLVSGSGLISTSTASANDAGDVTVTVGNKLTLSGGGTITSSTTGAGDAGNISITAGELMLESDPALQAELVALSNALLVSSSSAPSFAPGNGLSTISTNSSGVNSGASGTITINTGALFMNGGLITVNTDSNTATGTGDISIDASSIAMSNGAAITANASGDVNAGAISVSFENQLKMTDSAITTSSVASAGGDIIIDGSGGDLVLSNGTISTSAGGASADNSGGGITLNAIDLLLIDGTSSILAQANGGNGGAINIDAGFVLQEFGALINADSQLGNSGEITFSSPELDVTSAMADLDAPILDASNLLREACSAQAAKGSSSLVVEDATVRTAPGSYMSSKLPMSMSTLATSGKAGALPKDLLRLAQAAARGDTVGACERYAML